ncbi:MULTISPECIES: DNA-processing protein DprA [unclassified Polynucleobacter]|uniref:DNA-processing protein DprA n=1 Tax=unclassified Polynucleobacter TaxID=2640945 RepID=UPI001BFD106A|nr:MULTISPECIES: DNA-processing protein DprA [unclassified Polynucleobacter]MEA9602968.1 DNA-processing protein DprA [Polynucleobacter sp. JS-JIR-II-c23]QWE02528.1 DNA-protecting protein DprA [Polynucleobacter sp. JS-JIR-II-b4]
MQTSSTPNAILQIDRKSPYYPIRLHDLYDPPGCLYIYGDIHLLKRPVIAIVGSRNASPEGLKNAGLFAQALSKAGALIVSGLAKGVDSAAHQAVIELGPNHCTAAILGTGIDVVYPRQNIELSRAISQQGLLVSELPLGSGPKAWHFPRRNRIIAALAIGVVVIEAAEKSGSLITARLAADLGREVFALPGPIHNTNSAGCHLLIQQGAKLAFKPDDVLEEFSFLSKNSI